MADIFVSYAKEDRLYAQQTVTALQAAGYSVWWDDDITPHGSWDATIERELNAAKAVLVLWTPRSIESEFVRAEANWAKDQQKLLPVRLEPCPLPIAFSMVQTADLTDWDGDPDHGEWQRVLSWVRSFMSGKPFDPAMASQPAQPARRKPPRKAAYLVRAMIFAVLVAGGIFALTQSGLLGGGPHYVEAVEVDPPSCTRISSRAFLDPIDGGTCFQCGVDFARTSAAITSDRACEKPGGNGSYAAVKVGNDGPGIGNCPGGFMDLTVKGCWSCQGGTRTLAHITANDACTGARPAIPARAERLGDPVCADNAFMSAEGKCLTCPSGSSLTPDHECMVE